MLDLVIRGGQIVTPQGVVTGDVAIAVETIAAITAPGALPAGSAQREIDATGKIIMPGGIDPHVHCKYPHPLPDGTSFTTQGPEVVSRAALFGGTTTMIDFAIWNAGETIPQTIERRDKDWAGNCHCDYAYHVMVKGELPHTLMGEIGEAIAAGYPTVKIFTTDIAASWSTSATSGRCSRSCKSMAGSVSSTPRTTTSSCTCTIS